MLKALVPVDAAGNSLGAIRHVIKLVQEREPLEIHLLNVQASLPGDITRFLSKRVMDDYRHEETEKALAPARALLDAAGIAYTEHVIVGHRAECGPGKLRSERNFLQTTTAPHLRRWRTSARSLLPSC